MTTFTLALLAISIVAGTWFACELALLLKRELTVRYRRWRIRRDPEWLKAEERWKWEHGIEVK